MARTEYYWDEKTESFFEYLKSRNERLKKEHFELFVKQNELGEDVLQELMMIAFIFNEKDAEEFRYKFLEWYNNSPQYVLGGYTPNEMMSME